MAAKEIKTAKLASRGKAGSSKAVGTCTCGGDMVWSMVFSPRGRMMRVCEKCGIALPKAE
jgi:hypothetical protein